MTDQEYEKLVDELGKDYADAAYRLSFTRSHKDLREYRKAQVKARKDSNEYRAG
jgi:hypothetical protein